MFQILSRRCVWLIVMVLACAGCDSWNSEYPPNIEIEELERWPEPTWPDEKGDVPGVDFGCTWCAYEQRPNTLPFAIVWLDDRCNGRGGRSSNFHDYSSIDCTIELENDKKVRIDCYKANDKDRPMEFKIDGKPYDLAAGNFFLVSTHGDEIRVHQTSRNIGIKGMRFDRDSLATTAKTDEEIVGFFAAAAKKAGRAKQP